MGDYLYTSLPDGMTYVHDINQIQENGNNITPILTETNLSAVMDRHNDGTVKSYREKSFNLESILPNKSVDTFRDYILKGQNQSSRLAKASDLYIYGQNLLHMANQKIHILPMLTLQQNKSTQLNQAMILTESQARERSRVLQDGESWEILTNSSQRHVYMNQILSATLNGNHLHVQSYSAVPVRDLQIRAKIKNSEDWVILAKLDQLTPFSKANFGLKLTDQSRFPLLDGTGSIQLAGLSQTTQNPSNVFDLKISSETDEHVKKLNQIKAKWKIYFGTYDEPNKWCRITPVYAREWVMMMTNLAYMLSTLEFETLWFNHKAVMDTIFLAMMVR